MGAGDDNEGTITAKSEALAVILSEATVCVPLQEGLSKKTDSSQKRLRMT
jgi:hypothetical protein